jgi:16S rRNA (cytosine1402-N4)-methyltransferase
LMSDSTHHVPVLAEEVLEWLAPRPGQVFVDGTLGGGGHARLLAAAVGDGGRVIAVDRDAAAVERFERERPPHVVARHAKYAQLPEVLAELEIPAVDGILLDLGLSSDQLADESRGFSFQSEGPLDLRFDTSEGEPASRLLARLDERRLADLIYEYGEERFSRRIARAIVRRRREEPIRTAADLAQLVRRCVPRSRKLKIDPATRTFQALRIAVNAELEELETALRVLPDCLAPGGRLAIISFHSLEDRRVKNAFRGDDRLTVLTKKPVRPADHEVAANPRARSAKLRVAEKKEEEER